MKLIRESPAPVRPGVGKLSGFPLLFSRMLGEAAIRRRPPHLTFTSGTVTVETGSSTQMLKAIVRAGLLVALVMGVSAAAARADEIGRASCRERVCQYV